MNCNMMCSQQAERTLECELDKLRLENARLKKKLADRNDEKRDEKLVLSPARRANDLSPWNLCLRVQEKLAKKGFLESYRKSKLSDSLEKEATRNIGWWTLVSRPEPKKLDENLQWTKEKDLLDGPYLLINENDVVESIAIFVAQCLFLDPEILSLSADDIRKRIDGSFQEMHKKGLVRKAWDWAFFLHFVSHWTYTAFEIFSYPGTVKLLVTSILNSVAWLGLGQKLTAIAMSISVNLGQTMSSLKTVL